MLNWISGDKCRFDWLLVHSLDSLEGGWLSNVPQMLLKKQKKHSPDFCLIRCTSLRWFQHRKIKVGLPYTKLQLVQIGSTGLSIMETEGRNRKPFFLTFMIFPWAARHKDWFDRQTQREGEISIIRSTLYVYHWQIHRPLSFCAICSLSVSPVIVRWPVWLGLCWSVMFFWKNG